MATKYTVVFSESADQDVDVIYDGVSVFDQEAAQRLVASIYKMAYSLDLMPNRFARPWDKTLARKGFRHVVVKNYAIYYIVGESDLTVTIVRILHGAMDHARILRKHNGR